jgi:hypothetical protein
VTDLSVPPSTRHFLFKKYGLHIRCVFCLSLFGGFFASSLAQEGSPSVEPLQVEALRTIPLEAPPPEGAEETPEDGETLEGVVTPVPPVTDAPDSGPATAADLRMVDSVQDMPLGDPSEELDGDILSIEESIGEVPLEGPRGILDVGESPYEASSRMFESGSLIPVRPEGFDENLGASGFSSFSSQKREGFQLGAAMWVNYDSNVHKSARVPVGQNKEDWVFGFAPRIGYASRGSEWITRLDFQLIDQVYLENDNYGGLGYNFSGRLGYEGAKVDLAFRAQSALVRGGNRFSGGYQERYEHLLGVSAGYEISRKTRLETELDLRLKNPITGGAGDTQSVGWLTTGLWKYSPLFEVGPGFRYRFDTGERKVDRSTYSPLVRARYKLSSKVNFDAKLGGNFYDYASGGSLDPSIFASAGLRYRASSFWAVTMSILNDSMADESVAGAYRDTFGVRFGLDRKIYDGTLGVGLSYESIERTSPGAGALPLGDTESVSIDAMFSTPLWVENMEAAVFARWRDQTGSRATQTWDSIQAGVSIGYEY